MIFIKTKKMSQKGVFLALSGAIFLFNLLVVSAGWAFTVAVAPLEDLSKGGRNGVNLELTYYLSQQLADRGNSLIPGPAVVSFMARNRIRQVGYFDSKYILQAKEDLNADFLLFGTVCQLTENKTSPSLGLTLFLVRTADASPVWTKSMGLSIADVQRLLGIKEPQTTKDLLPLLVQSLLATWPSNMEEIAARPLRQFDDKSLAMNVDLDTVLLEPKFAQAGDNIRCRFRILDRNPEGDREKPQAYIKVGSRVLYAREVPGKSPGRFAEKSSSRQEASLGSSHKEAALDNPFQEASQETSYKEAARELPYKEASLENSVTIAALDESAYEYEASWETSGSEEIYKEAKIEESLDSAALDGKFYEYEVSWSSSDVAVDQLSSNGIRQPVRVASAATEALDLEGVWPGRQEPGVTSFPVNLTMYWPSGENKSLYLGRYTVDTKAPDPILQVKGRRIKGVPSFRDRLVMRPYLASQEPIERWALEIFDSTGRKVLFGSQEGGLPPVLVWSGQVFDEYGKVAEEGQYTLAFKAWDRAGNMGLTSEKVAYYPNLPRIDFSASEAENASQVVLTLGYGGEVPLKYWRMELWTGDNDLMETFEGNKLPVSVQLDREKLGQTGCLVVSEDILGGRHQDKVVDLFALVNKVDDESDGAAPASDLQGNDAPVVSGWLSDF